MRGDRGDTIYFFLLLSLRAARAPAAMRVRVPGSGIGAGSVRMQHPVEHGVRHVHAHVLTTSSAEKISDRISLPQVPSIPPLRAPESVCPEPAPTARAGPRTPLLGLSARRFCSVEKFALFLMGSLKKQREKGANFFGGLSVHPGRQQETR